jgi:hypothetical protein
LSSSLELVEHRSRILEHMVLGDLDHDLQVRSGPAGQELQTLGRLDAERRRHGVDEQRCRRAHTAVQRALEGRRSARPVELGRQVVLRCGAEELRRRGQRRLAADQRLVADDIQAVDVDHRLIDGADAAPQDVLDVLRSRVHARCEHQGSHDY